MKDIKKLPKDTNIKSVETLADGFGELQQYNDAQFKTIIDLQKKLDQLESENKSLKLMLEQTVPAFDLTFSDIAGISNQRLICETQIAMLKQAGMTRAMTLEETKKLQIFVDILSKSTKVSDEPFGVKQLSDEDLLKIVQIDGKAK